jgi:hypothetical protein
MSPEQLHGSDVDARSDIYSFGLLVFELVTGDLPWASRWTPPEHGEQSRTPDERVPGLPQLSGGLDVIVRTCLRPDPDARYQNTETLVSDLERLRKRVLAPHSAALHPVPGAPRPLNSWFSPQLWWVYHQLATIVLYASMVYPMWIAKMWTGADWMLAIFFGVVACAAINGALRIHLLFTYAFHQEDIRSQLGREGPWIRRWDWVFAGLIIAATVPVASTHTVTAVVFTVVALAFMVTVRFVEPTTTRKAFLAPSPL